MVARSKNFPQKNKSNTNSLHLFMRHDYTWIPRHTLMHDMMSIGGGGNSLKKENKNLSISAVDIRPSEERGCPIHVVVQIIKRNKAGSIICARYHHLIDHGIITGLSFFPLNQNEPCSGWYPVCVCVCVCHRTTCSGIFYFTTRARRKNG